MPESTAITLHPAVAFYRVAIAALQHQLRQLLAAWFELVEEQRPRLLARYAELFGDLEFELQQQTLRAAQAKRLCELVYLARQRGQQVTDELLQRMCAFVVMQHRGYHSTVERGSGTVRSASSGEHSSLAMECARLYRDIVKRLHPDREGDPGLFERFWNVVQEAYATGNLQRLRVVHGILCIDAQYRLSADEGLDGLERTYRRLLHRVDYEQRRLVRLRNEEPFAFAALLDDPDWVAQRRAQLQRDIARQQRIVELARQELRALGAERWEEHVATAAAEDLSNAAFNEEFFRHTYSAGR